MKYSGFKPSWLLAIFTIVLIGLSTAPASAAKTEQEKADKAHQKALKKAGWRPAWSDEFNGTDINSSNWSHEVNCQGGGNNEKQCYTARPDNSYVADGALHIVAKEEVFSGPAHVDDDPNYDPNDTSVTLPFTSARLRTKGKVDFKYGRAEIRAKVADGQGMWPAIWMLPTDYVYGGWPSSGEIDIFESFNPGPANTEVAGTLHYGLKWPQWKLTGAGFELEESPAADFHVYAIEWEEDEIRWYVDGQHYQTQRSEGWYNYIWQGQQTGFGVANPRAPFDENFHLILNMAVGGDPVGAPETNWPADREMLVDYVRLYECKYDSKGSKGCAIVDESVQLNADVGAPGVNDFLIFADGVETLDLGSVTNTVVPGHYDNDTGLVSQSVSDVWSVEFGGAGSVFLTSEDMSEVEGFDTGVNLAGGHSWSNNGEIEFDMLVLNAASDSQLTVKLDSGWPNVGEKVIDIPPVGEWQHVAVSVADLVANPNPNGGGVNLSNVLNLFVLEYAGSGASVQLDNIRLQCAVNTDPEPWQADQNCSVEAKAAIVAPSGDTLGVFSETHIDPVLPITSIQNSIEFGGNNTIADPNSTAIPAFEGGVVMSVEYQDSSSSFGGVVLNFGAVDISAFDTLNFTIDTSGINDFADMTIQMEPPGAGAAGTKVLLSNYTPIETTGNWKTYAIPLSNFPVTNFAAMANLGFWNVLDSAGMLTFGTLYLDDIHYSSSGGGTGGGGGGTGNSLLTNGTFDNDLNGWNLVGFVASEPNNIYQADVTAAGNPWDVNLSQVITLIPDETYTLTFKAKASVARNMIAGLGLNDAPWTAVTEDVALSTEWQVFTYTLTTSGFGDANSRVLFDMGAQVGTVNIDDVSVSIQGSAAELLTNGSFDADLNSWNLVGFVTSENNNIYQADVAAAGNPWDVNLSQVITLVPDETYRLIFRAKASVARNMVAGLGLNDAPWTAVTEVVALSTEWQTFIYTLTTTDFGDANSRVLFDMGAEIGTVNIDDVSVTPQGSTGGGGGTGGGELATNGDFELGALSGWAVAENGGAITADSTQASGGTWSGHVVAGPGNNPALSQADLAVGTVSPGDTIDISFDMCGSAAAGGVIFPALLSEFGGGTGADRQDLDTIASPPSTWTRYNYSATAGANVNGGISVQFDVVCGTDAGCSADVYFDNVSVTIGGGAVGGSASGESCVGGGGGGGLPGDVDGDGYVYLYATDPGTTVDLIADTDFFIQEWGSGSTINGAFASDSDYNPVIQVVEGSGWGAQNAVIAFTGLTAGFAENYAFLNFKIKDLPTGSVWVKFASGGGAELEAEFDLAAYATDIPGTTGWKQVVIPLSSFPDSSAYTEFAILGGWSNGGTFLLTDVAFTDMGGGGGGGGGAGSIDFEVGGYGAGVTWNVFENDDNAALEFVANPASDAVNSSAQVAKFTARVGGMPWAGTEMPHGSFGPMTLDASNSTVKIMVYKSVISDVGIKFAIPNGGAQPEIKVANTLINQWEELTFDFSGQIGTAESIGIDQIIVFPDFDLAGRTTENVVYFDNITFNP